MGRRQPSGGGLPIRSASDRRPCGPATARWPRIEADHPPPHPCAALRAVRARALDRGGCSRCAPHSDTGGAKRGPKADRIRSDQIRPTRTRSGLTRRQTDRIRSDSDQIRSDQTQQPWPPPRDRAGPGVHQETTSVPFRNRNRNSDFGIPADPTGSVCTAKRSRGAGGATS